LHVHGTGLNHSLICGVPFGFEPGIFDFLDLECVFQRLGGLLMSLSLCLGFLELLIELIDAALIFGPLDLIDDGVDQERGGDDQREIK